MSQLVEMQICVDGNYLSTIINGSFMTILQKVIMETISKLKSNTPL